MGRRREQPVLAGPAAAVAIGEGNEDHIRERWSGLRHGRVAAAV
jgi:hypothetical protein